MTYHVFEMRLRILLIHLSGNRQRIDLREFQTSKEDHYLII